jgi:Zn-dependent metalloprotease
MRDGHPPLCSIIPPHILRHIAEGDGGTDPADRLEAHASLELSAQIRGSRLALGAIPGMLAIAAGEKRRTIYDARHQLKLPGQLVRAEGSAAAKDPAVNEAYDGAGRTYDFYRDVLQRNSIDDRGMRLDSSVHYGIGFNNAQWDGRQMIYGDGDGRIFNRFTRSLDVVGHELTHGVTQYTAALAYHGQSGALNEHMSDVFGLLVKQYTLKQTVAKSDWIIGGELFTSRIHGHGIRSLKAPGTAYDDPAIGKDPQPAHMRDYNKSTADNGGVHINSGIPNHAFYQVARLLGGKAWEVAGRIWYRALTHKLHRDSQFQDAARATHTAAVELYGEGSAPAEAVIAGWRAVGVVVASAVAGKGPRISVRRADRVVVALGGGEVPGTSPVSPSTRARGKRV